MQIELTASDLDGIYVGVPFPAPGLFGVVIGQTVIDGVAWFGVMDDYADGIPDNERRVVLMTRESVAQWRLD